MAKRNSSSSKSTKSSSGSSKSSSSGTKSTGSAKNIYRSSDGISTSKSKAPSTNKSTASPSNNLISQRRTTGATGARITIGKQTIRNSRIERTLRSNPSTDNSGRKDTSSLKSTYTGQGVKSASSQVYGHSRVSDDSKAKGYRTGQNFDKEEKEDKVNAAKLVYGIGEQAANKLVGGVANALDLFIGTPFQKGLDFAEEKLKLPDMGINPISAFNNYMQDVSAKDAAYFAENASKGEIASKINQYGPDVVAFIPEAALAASSGGTTAVASAGVKGLSAVSKLDDISDAMKVAGKWLKNNPTAALNFLQTSGNAHKQALSEGATEQEALAYALLNGGSG